MNTKQSSTVSSEHAVGVRGREAIVTRHHAAGSQGPLRTKDACSSQPRVSGKVSRGLHQTRVALCGQPAGPRKLFATPQIASVVPLGSGRRQQPGLAPHHFWLWAARIRNAPWCGDTCGGVGLCLPWNRLGHACHQHARSPHAQAPCALSHASMQQPMPVTCPQSFLSRAYGQKHRSRASSWAESSHCRPVTRPLGNSFLPPRAQGAPAAAPQAETALPGPRTGPKGQWHPWTPWAAETLSGPQQGRCCTGLPPLSQAVEQGGAGAPTYRGEQGQGRDSPTHVSLFLRGERSGSKSSRTRFVPILIH